MLTRYGIPFLRWLEVTVCDFHAYVHAWATLLGVSTSGQGLIGHGPVTDGDRRVTDHERTCHGV